MQKHVFQIEKLRKIALYGVILIVSLILLLILLLQTSYIQTKITKYITELLSEKLKTDIEIDNVRLRLFRGFEFKGIYIADQQKDTLLYVKEVLIVPVGLQTDFSNLSFKSLKIDSLYFNLYEVGKDTLNLQFIVDALQPEDSKDSDKDFQLKCKKISIKNSKFSYQVLNKVKKNQLDFENLNLDSINLSFTDFKINNETITSKIENISLKDKCGFKIENFISEKVAVSPKFIHLKKFTLETGHSKLLFDSLNLDYPNNYDFSEYKTKLKTNIVINKPSFLSYNDLKYFVNDSSDNQEKVFISAQIKGTYDKFDIKDLDVKYEGLIELKLDSKVENFTDFKNTSLFVDVEKLEVDFQKFQAMKIPGKDLLLMDLPENVKKIKTISYSGLTKGKLSNFITKGDISGNFGNISITAIAKRDTVSNFNVKGKLSGTNLDIAQTFDNSDFGTMGFDQEFNFTLFRNKKIKLKTSGIINEFYYKKHLYKNINLYAELNDKKIDSISVFINQNTINASIVGSVDFFSKIPAVNLEVNVNHADLKSLNLNDAEFESFIKFNSSANFKGITIDDFIGSVELLSPLSYIKDSLILQIDKLKLKGYATENIDINEKIISLTSDIADAEIITSNSASETFKSLKKLILTLFQQNTETLITDENELTGKTGTLNIEANIKEPDFLAALFLPEYQISSGTKIYGFYESESESLNLSLNSETLKYRNYKINDFYIIAYTKNNKLNGGIGGSSLYPNENLYIENVNLEGDLSNDTINFNLNWNNFKDTANLSANISGLIKMKQNELNKTYYDCFFNHSDFNINDVIWTFNNASMEIDSSHISIHNLNLKNNKQTIYIDGNISNYPGDFLYTEYKNFKLSNLQTIIPDDITISGELSGSTVFAQLYEDPLVFTRDSVSKLNINSIDFGNLYFKSNWNEKEKKIHADAYVLKGSQNQFMNDTIYGDYWPYKDSINFTFVVRSMLLRTFEDYYSELVAFNPSSFVTGEINIFGNIKNPSLIGDLTLKQTTAHLKYLNTFYNISELGFTISNNDIIIKNTKIQSSNKNGFGHLKGLITHQDFKNFILDIDIDANNLKLMDLIPTDSSFFYGTAYGTGNINIAGPINDIKLDANIKTEKETYVFIPISTNEILDDEKNFIQFVSDTSKSKTNNSIESYNVDMSGFSMNMKLNVTPDAEIQIIPTESGDIITKGEGGLNLTLDKEGSFNIFGTYIIDKGTYKLDLDIFSRIFNIQKGSKINWSGDPEDANVDITALYSIENVPLNSLVKADNEPIVKSKVICSIKLSDALLNPTLKLNIEIAENVSSNYINKLNSFDEKEISQQFLSLLVQRRFLSLGTGGNSGTNDPTPLTGELLTGQLNNILEKVISNDVNLDVIWEPGKENITNEIGLSVSGTAFDNWVTYKGGVGKGGTTDVTQEENYVGEFELEAKLNRKGNIRAKFYNKANDAGENEGDYTQGLGFVFRKKFDSFIFWKRREELDSIK